uniref:Polyprotein n=1 Tax=Insectivora picornavirus TaxID=3039002 RepID=A0AAT9TYB8_9PICO|nr:MAG: polyprotein [Insectivora picornavirus]
MRKHPARLAMDGRDIAKICRSLGRLQSYRIKPINKRKFYITPKYNNILEKGRSMHTDSPIPELMYHLDKQIFIEKLKSLGIETVENPLEYNKEYLLFSTPVFMTYATTNFSPNQKKFSTMIGPDNLLHFLQTHEARRHFSRQHTYYHFSNDLFTDVFPTKMFARKVPSQTEKCPFFCRSFRQDCSWHSGWDPESDESWRVIERRRQFMNTFRNHWDDSDFWCSLVMEVNHEENRKMAGKHIETYKQSYQMFSEWANQHAQSVDWQKWAEPYPWEVEQAQGDKPDVVEEKKDEEEETSSPEASIPKDLYSTIYSKLSTVMQAMQDAREHVPDFIKKHQTSIINIVIALINMVLVPKWQTIGLMTLLITNCILAICGDEVKAAVTKMIEAFKKVMTKFFCHTEAAPTAADDYKAYNESFITSLFGLLSSVAPWAKEVEPGIYKARIERIKKSALVLGTATSIVAFITVFLEKIWKWIQIWWKGGSREDYEEVVGIISEKRIEKWIQEVEDFELQPMKNGTLQSGLSTLVYNEESRNKVIELRKQGEALLRKLNIHAPKSIGLINIVKDTLRKVNGWFKVIEPMLGLSKNKHEPFVIHLYGAPGIGKSHAVNYILAALCRVLESKTFRPNVDTFTKPRDSEYFDGYTGQFGFIMDDFLQMTDPLLRAAEVAFLVDAASRSDFHLNMSAVEDKACTYFRSPVIVLTTNKPLSQEFVGNVITEYGAIARRIDLSVEVVKHREIDYSQPFDTGACSYKIEKYVTDPSNLNGTWRPLSQCNLHWDLFVQTICSYALVKRQVQERQDQMPNLYDLNFESTVNYNTALLKTTAKNGSPWQAMQEYIAVHTSPDPGKIERVGEVGPGFDNRYDIVHLRNRDEQGLFNFTPEEPYKSYVTGYHKVGVTDESIRVQAEKYRQLSEITRYEKDAEFMEKKLHKEAENKNKVLKTELSQVNIRVPTPDAAKHPLVPKEHAGTDPLVPTALRGMPDEDGQIEDFVDATEVETEGPHHRAAQTYADQLKHSERVWRKAHRGKLPTILDVLGGVSVRRDISIPGCNVIREPVNGKLFPNRIDSSHKPLNQADTGAQTVRRPYPPEPEDEILPDLKYLLVKEEAQGAHTWIPARSHLYSSKDIIGATAITIEDGSQYSIWVRKTCRVENLAEGEATSKDNSCFYDSFAQLMSQVTGVHYDYEEVRSKVMEYESKKANRLTNLRSPFRRGQMLDTDYIHIFCEVFHVNVCLHVPHYAEYSEPCCMQWNHYEDASAPLLHIQYRNHHFTPLFPIQARVPEAIRTYTCVACNRQISSVSNHAELARHILSSMRCSDESFEIHSSRKHDLAAQLHKMALPQGRFLTAAEERVRKEMIRTKYEIKGAPLQISDLTMYVQTRPELVRAYIDYYQLYDRPTIIERYIVKPLEYVLTPSLKFAHYFGELVESATSGARQYVSKWFPTEIKEQVQEALKAAKEAINSFKKWAIVGVLGIVGAATLGLVLATRRSQESNEGYGPSSSERIPAGKRKKTIVGTRFSTEANLPKVTYNGGFKGMQSSSNAFEFEHVGLNDDADIEIRREMRGGVSGYSVVCKNFSDVGGFYRGRIDIDDLCRKVEKAFTHQAESKASRIQEALTVAQDYPIQEVEQSEASRDVAASDLIKRVCFNQFIARDLTSGVTLRGFFLRDRIAFMPAHVLGSKSLDSPHILKIHVHRAATPLEFHLSKNNCVVDRENDAMFIDMSSTNLSAFQDIVPRFIKEEDRIDLTDGYVVVPQATEREGRMDLVHSKQVRKMMVVEHVDYVDSQTQHNYNVARGIRYEADTESGDCGSLTVRIDHFKQRKLLGCHIAGLSGRGTSLLLTQEYLHDGISRLPQAVQGVCLPFATMRNVEEFFDVMPEQQDEDEFFDALSELPYVTILGDTMPQFTPSQPTKTAIRKSKLHGKLIEPQTKPVHQNPFEHDGKRIEPQKLALSKLESPQILFDQKIVDAAATKMMADYHIAGRLEPYCSKERGKLSEVETVKGIEGDPWVRPLNMHTSPGYPFVLGGCKADYLDGDSGEYGVELRALVENREKEAQKGVQTPAVIVDVMKDERLPNAKVDAGKVRLFNVCPLDYNLLIRKYFTRFLAQMMDQHVDGEVSVGINPHSSEWGMLYRRLKARGEHWVAGDYSAWDKRAPIQVARAVLTVVEAFYKRFDDYDPKDAVVRATLIEQAYSSVRMAVRGRKGLLYQVHQSMPSGIAVTAVYNSLVNALLFRIIYAELAMGARKSFQWAINTYKDFVTFAAYGDDHIVRVHESVFDWFNMISISEQMAKHHIGYTSATKDEVSLPGVPDCDLQYLKRKFVLRYGWYDGPMDISAVLDITNWVQAKTDYDQKIASECAVLSVLIELSHHDELTWNEWYPKIFRACMEVGYECPYVDYAYAVNKRRETEPAHVEDNWF